MHEIYFWIGFHVLIALLLAIDLGIFTKKKVISARSAWLQSASWVALALLFNFFVYLFFGSESGLQFFLGYIIEKSLSIDNLFVFLIIFLHFRIPERLQHKVLFWGILGALVFRLSLIFAGVVLINRFHWIIYLLGVFLIFTAIQIVLQRQKSKNPSRFLVYLFLKKILPVEEEKGKGKFFVKISGKWKVTSLFVVLLLIETTDILFALDSIPAIFAITTDPFIIYTSNVFAILGLRSLYFVLAKGMSRLKHYKLGLSAILAFVGFKMVLTDIVAIPLFISLAVIVIILAATILFSLRDRSQE